jgi:Zn-dependent peptidase ImmA (M78 family)
MKKTDVLRALIRNLQDEAELAENSALRVLVSRDLDLDDDIKKMIMNFCNYSASRLGLEGQYKCYISFDRQKSGIKTTGICMPDRNEIKVYGKNRSLADILRSIAHEMFHLRQHEMGVIPLSRSKKHFEEPLEWHANAAAGSIVSKFASTVGRDKVYR